MTARTDLDSVRIHPALNRSLLIAGVERKAMIPMVGMVLMFLLLFNPNPITPILAVLVVVVVFPALRRVNKRDPQWTEVLLEHVRVSGFYRAQGEPLERRQSCRTV